MKKIYHKLLILSLHYFAAFAQCNKTSSYKILPIYSALCPKDNYYCDSNQQQNVVAVFLTCFNTNIPKMYEAIQNELRNNYYCYIILKNSSIPVLNPTGYHWNYVKTLQIEETYTNEIIPGFFNQFDQLEELHIIKNKITKLTSGEFTSIVLLRVLNLTENLIETVAPKSFSGLLNLAILDLSKNKITNLPENIFEYQNHLFFVDVSNNMLKNIDGAVFNKQSLKTLNISYNYLSDFDFNQFKNLTKLEYLRFDHNILSSLPIYAFYNLHNLSHLDLSFNQIRQIPFGLFNDLSKLTDLDLSSNNMVLDFHTLSTLKSLKVLKFTNNTVENLDFDTISSRFKYLESITLLNDQSWNCYELAKAIDKLHFNNISVIRAQSTNGSNILGISCDNSTNLFFQKNPDPREKANETVTSTLFLKFMQNWNKYAASVTNSLTNIEAYNMKKIDTTNVKENVPWQNISLPLNDISNNLKQIFRINSMPMAKNVGSSEVFNQTLINLTNSLNNLKQVPVESKALINEKHEESIGSVFTNILLAMILCCLILSAYRNYLKSRIMNNSVQEVQLM